MPTREAGNGRAVSSSVYNPASPPQLLASAHSSLHPPLPKLISAQCSVPFCSSIQGSRPRRKVARSIWVGRNGGRGPPHGRPDPGGARGGAPPPVHARRRGALLGVRLPAPRPPLLRPPGLRSPRPPPRLWRRHPPGPHGARARPRRGLAGIRVPAGPAGRPRRGPPVGPRVPGLAVPGRAAGRVRPPHRRRLAADRAGRAVAAVLGPAARRPGPRAQAGPRGDPQGAAPRAALRPVLPPLPSLPRGEPRVLRRRGPRPLLRPRPAPLLHPRRLLPAPALVGAHASSGGTVPRRRRRHAAQPRRSVRREGSSLDRVLERRGVGPAPPRLVLLRSLHVVLLRRLGVRVAAEAGADAALGGRVPGQDGRRAEAGRVAGQRGHRDGGGGRVRVGIRRRGERRGRGRGLRRGARRARAQGRPLLRLAPPRRVELRGRLRRARARRPPVQGAAAPRREDPPGDRRQGRAAREVGGAAALTGS
ncbi:hypothetical protein PR202_ga21243 [Eleusine coracana subsp. coracana]|uniref:Uncharacterized protein n=1 Tax=Eleusine coracana subsp. coracana TaxID=191504 RepID=A0AAV5D0H8_ELECO|nr:hypothetical protein PR202_ga21243 [Eleusine coracana subsp. coracana]